MATIKHIINIFRREFLRSGATVALSTGTALDLYPIENVVNGRPEVPLRSADVALVIDIDLASVQTINFLGILANNFEGSPGTVQLQAGIVGFGGPWLFDQIVSPFFGDGRSDFWAANLLQQTYFDISNLGLQYFRLTISQGGRQNTYTNVGEIFIGNVVNRSWFDVSNVEATINQLAWPVMRSAYIDNDVNSRIQGVKVASDYSIRADLAGLASLLEQMILYPPIAPHIEDQLRAQSTINLAGQINTFQFQELRKGENFQISAQGETILKQIQGDGRAI